MRIAVKMMAVAALGWSVFAPSAEAGICRWRDANGVHYSDAPPPGVKCEGTVKAPTSSPGPAPSTAPGAGQKGYQAQDLEYKQRRLEKEEAERKAEQERQRQEQARQTCAEWKARVAGLKSGGRVVKYGPDGERTFLSDEDIAQEIANAERQAAQWCR
jgi:hypothetical protein